VACTSCAAGKFTAATGSTDCTNCAAGTYLSTTEIGRASCRERVFNWV
jgi:hypothetical protein